MSIRKHIKKLVITAVTQAIESKSLPETVIGTISVEKPQKSENGDFACSLPLKLAQPMKMNPMEIAEKISSQINNNEIIEKVWTARPGFINFSIQPGWLSKQIDVIREEGEDYGKSNFGSGQLVQIEFVSVNPTGPLHIGHARGAVLGSTLSNILAFAGCEIQREYYFNDAGSQIDRFNESLFARYMQEVGEDIEVPPNGYHGEYMIELAKTIIEKDRDKLKFLPKSKILSKLGSLGINYMVKMARADMHDLKVHYDNWFSERSLHQNGQFQKSMDLLEQSGYLVKRDGAIWFTSTKFGDDEDKVFVRSNGSPTYFATDVAYHYNKFLERHFDRVINILGADHQGHVRFMKTVPHAIGVDENRLELIIYQLVTLKRGSTPIRASKRTGNIISLREVLDEVGADACRYFFLTRSPQSQMEFDLDLAKAHSSENPAYYVQYAHARISSILRVAEERKINFSCGDLSLIQHEKELELVKKLLEFPEIIELMARNLEPQLLPHYTSGLATTFHAFYEKCRIVSSISGEESTTKARLKLIEATRFVLANCLDLMGMQAPETM